ncbi:MAG: GntR family transcriptional regulator [Nitratireductor sp.]|nr:GntR family transcriptional regulator [Nitratireductor sp.]
MTVFSQIRQDRSADEVAHQIEGLILEGVLRSGDQLPGERELAVETGVSRPVVREAIELMEARGLLQKRHGEGTFVCDIIGQVFSEPIAALLPHHHKATRDYLEYRREIEAIAAGMAAERATHYDREMLMRCVERMKRAHERQDFAEEARADLELHSLLGEMTHNLVLLHTLRACYRLLSEGIFQNRSRFYEKTGARQSLLDQHLAIANAVLAGDRAGAMQAARDHVSYVMEKSLELDGDLERERIAALRYRKRAG